LIYIGGLREYEARRKPEPPDAVARSMSSPKTSE
jgi:hypothetical protein